MRESLRESLARVVEQAEFNTRLHLGKAALAMALLVETLVALILVSSGLEPGAYLAALIPSSIIYTFIASIALTSLAEELATGQALAHLAHPLTRREYVASWLVAGPLLFSGVLAAAVAAPILIVEPRFLLDRATALMLLYALLEPAYHSIITIAASLAARSRPKALAAVLGLQLVAPVITALALDVATAVLHASLDEAAFRAILSVFHPVLAALPFETTVPTGRPLILATLAVAAVLIAASLLVARLSSRLEV